VSNFVAIGQTAAEIWQFFDLSEVAAAAILIFVHLKFLRVGRVQRVELRHYVKLRDDRPDCCRDMAIFLFNFSQDGGRHHLGFLNF